jgi:hypothetical protein
MELSVCESAGWCCLSSMLSVVDDDHLFVFRATRYMQSVQETQLSRC